MTIVANTRRITAACAALAALLICAKAAQPLKLDFSEDTVGAEPKAFLSVVGVWQIEAEKNNKVLAVDGRQWKEGQTSAGIADKARALYGDRYAEFLDRVQAYCILPLHRGQGRDRFPRRRDSRVPVRREFQAASIEPAGILSQPQAQRRLPDDPRQSAREQPGAVEIRKGQALLRPGFATHRPRRASGTISRSASQ